MKIDPPKERSDFMTTIRAALKPESSLRPRVKDGLGAIIKAHRNYFDQATKSSFEDSLDIDEGLKKGQEQENRWDYLLGPVPSKQIIGVEPHSAATGEITPVIEKLEAARRQMRDHFRDGKLVAKWL